jgi:hypothetical protein
MLHPSRLIPTAIACALVLTPLAGCGPALAPSMSTVAPVQGNRVPSSSGLVIATSEGGRGVKRIALGASTAAYSLLDIVHFRDEVNSLRLALSRMDLNDPQNPIEDSLNIERTFTAAQIPAPNTPILFTGLKEDTHYRVRAYAEDVYGYPISDDNQSYVDFYIDHDDDVALQDDNTEQPLVVPVVKVGYTPGEEPSFDGRGLTPGLNIQNGAYTLFGFVYNHPITGYPGLNNPGGVAVDRYGNRYVTDTGNHCIVRIEPDGTALRLIGQPHTPGFLDGDETDALFNGPEGIIASDVDPQDLNDADDVVLWVADTGNHVIRKVVIEDGPRAVGISVSNKVGTPETLGFQNGSGVAAKLNAPRGVFLRGRTLYIADAGNHCIRTYEVNSTQVNLLAGQPDNEGSTDNAKGSLARFVTPAAVLEEDGWLYVADRDDHTIRKIAVGPGDPRHAVSTIAGWSGSPGFGDGSVPYLASMDTPSGLAIDTDHHLYVSDTNNNAIRRIDLAGDDPQLTTLCGSATGDPTNPAVQVKLGATLGRPTGMCMDANGRLYVVDSGNNLLRYIE